MPDDPGERRLLIVDDTPANIRVLGEVLSDYDRVVATSGEKALERARSNPPPDLVLLDVMMPGMDGFEVCRRLKADARTRSIPVIFVTAMGEVTDETEGLEIGAVDYVTKPFSPSVVRARVRTHLELKAARDALEDINALLEARVAERTVQLRDALHHLEEGAVDTIVRLSRAAEFKDDSTGAHILRMSHYAAAIARQLGFAEQDVRDILHASPLHDVGKIGVPDRVLLKPGTLDEEEWRIMRRHCKMGERILSGSAAGVLQLGETIAMSHHERWDGTGYPRGLAGEDIPIVGRIVAVADVFDALMSRRPYKPPFSYEHASRLMREGRGTHFDPRVLDAFFEIDEEILLIRDRFQDADVIPLALE